MAGSTAARSSLKSQLTRFVAVGVLTAAIDYSLTMILIGVGANRQLAKAFGWVFGTIAAYLLNSKFTFGAALSGSKAAAVLTLYASTFAVQNFLWWATDVPLQALGFDGAVKNTISFVIAQGVATLTNFFMQRLLIFRPKG
ncbi:GtrA family protein [Corynebacterium uterequi]|uniref:Putative membrane protein n=1 Tax=Corynebacterium uterequi TaxID=1072256 RepID=A0A0G3H9Z8_9CORY|nr:GtrA family protein [Corynebacterium uterequi]AKK10119.1 putative membrane protein [Corynebacterium uterequi]